MNSNSKPCARASLFCIGLMFVLPFLQPYHKYPIPSFYGEWLAFALGLAAALLLLRRDLWFQPDLPTVALAPLALIAFLGIQIILGRTLLIEQALTAVLYLAWAALLIMLGAVLGREFGTATLTTILATSLIIGGVLNAVAGVLQHFWQPGALGPLVAPKSTVAVAGNIGQANHFADYLALALASAAYLFARGNLRARWAAILAVLSLLVLSLSGSRSPWIYLGTFAVLAALWRTRARSAEHHRLFRFCIFLLPGLLVADWLVTLPFMVPPAGTVLTSGQRWFEVASGYEARIQLAREAWTLYVEAPLLGAGWGQFTWHHFQSEALTGARAAHGVYNHAHNLILQLLAETGAAGAVIVAGAALGWLWDRRGMAIDLEHWWLLSALSVLAIHSMLEMPLWYSNFLGIAAVLLGAGAKRFLNLRTGQIPRIAVAAVVAIGCLNLGWVLATYRDFERLVLDTPKRLTVVPDTKEVISEVLKIHRDPILANYVEVAVSGGITIDQDRLRDKIELNSRVMRFSPGDLAVYRQALLLALADERETALRQLDWAAHVYPDRLPHAIETIRTLTRSHPDKFNPLLEAALARHANSAAPVVAR